jgi:CHAD domain-containing protein
MSTLAEIETAVDQLPLADQEELLHRLTVAVRRRRAAVSPAAMEQWMDRLDALRASIGSGRQTLTTGQIIAEGREERN